MLFTNIFKPSTIQLGMKKEALFIISGLAVLVAGGAVGQRIVSEKPVNSTPQTDTFPQVTLSPTETPRPLPTPSPTAEKQPVEKYRPGEFVFIEDTDQEHPGVLLRQDPRDTISPELTAVFQRDLVKILGDPVTVKQWWDDKTRKFWLVRVIARSESSINSVGFPPNAEGWIPEEYLGDQFYSYSK